MRKQHGLSLSGLILALFLVCVGALLGFKLFTPYMQYFAVKKAFKTISDNPALRSGTPREVLGAYQRQAAIDDLRTLTEDDLDISKEGGRLVISTKYTIKLPLFANYSLLIDFAPSSAAK